MRIRGTERETSAPRALVVDDDECIRELLAIHLSNAGYEVALAEDAVEAIQFLLRTPPQLMLVDVDMPYLSGLELARILKADAALGAIALILLTERHGVEEEARQAGVVACLRKPLLASRLMCALQAAAPSGRLALG